MASDSMNKLIGRATHDEAFRKLMLQNPKSAAQTLGVTLKDNEIKALTQLTDSLFSKALLQDEANLGTSIISRLEAGGWNPNPPGG